VKSFGHGASIVIGVAVEGWLTINFSACRATRPMKLLLPACLPPA